MRRRRRLTPRVSRSPATRLRESHSGDTIRRRLRAAGSPDDPVSFALRLLGWAGAAAGAAGLWMGPVAAAVAAGAVVAIVLGGLRSRIRGRSHRIDESLPALLDGLAAALRAGASLPMAIADVEPPAPLADAIDGARAALGVGASLAEALVLFAGIAGTDQVRLVASALTIGGASGGDLPRVLEVLAESARDRTRLIREARVASAQARLSAWVVAALPVVFLFLTGAASREQVRLLLGTPIGWALLGVGGALEAAGIVWMRRLAA